MRYLRVLLIALLGLWPAGLWAMGMEDFGDQPISEQNYAQWRNIMPLLTAGKCVYHSWVNGNEQFYYRGGLAGVNDALRKFAAVEAEAHEVLVRPGPGETMSFQPEKMITFDWDVHLLGGIAGHLTTLDQGAKVWSKSPMMTVYLGREIRREKLEVPKGVVVIGVGDLAKRYREALASKDKTVRGWTAVELAVLDPTDSESAMAVAGLLKDEDNWVRLSAAGALAEFGASAKGALPALRAALEQTTDAALKERLEKAIAEIEEATKAGK